MPSTTVWCSITSTCRTRLRRRSTWPGRSRRSSSGPSKNVPRGPKPRQRASPIRPGTPRATRSNGSCVKSSPPASRGKSPPNRRPPPRKERSPQRVLQREIMPDNGKQADLAIIVVSTNEASWLPACLSTVFAHDGGASLDVVVVDNESTDGTRQLVEGEFPDARVVSCANHGFSHANNRGLMTTRAPYVLFHNPDTEMLEGTFGELVSMLDRRPEIGLLGVKQINGHGELFPTIRRFPNVGRAFAEAVTAERWRLRPGWIGE